MSDDKHNNLTKYVQYKQKFLVNILHIDEIIKYSECMTMKMNLLIAIMMKNFIQCQSFACKLPLQTQHWRQYDSYSQDR